MADHLDPFSQLKPPRDDLVYQQPQPTPSNGMARGFWIATLFCGCLGTLFLFPSLTGSAPQQAAGGAVAAAFVVIPYCMARALSELRR